MTASTATINTRTIFLNGRCNVRRFDNDRIRNNFLKRLPADWRDRLPDPATYYATHVAKLSRPNATGWAQGVCPFHDDHSASLSVQVADPRGGWRCFAGCGGGDLVGFHMRLRGMDFTSAVRDLIGVRP